MNCLRRHKSTYFCVISWYIDGTGSWNLSLRWRHNGHDCVSNHQPHDCLRNRLYRRRSKKTSKLRVTGLCVGNSPETGEFPAQMASNAENVSIWWRHHVLMEKNQADKNPLTQHNQYDYCWKPGFLIHQSINIQDSDLSRNIITLVPDGLTHWGRVTHICVGELTIIASDNDLSPARRQAIIWTNAGILLIGTLGTNFSETLIGIQTFSFTKMHL